MTDPQLPLEKPTLDKDLDKLSLIETGTQSVLFRAAAPGLAFLFLVTSAIFAAIAMADLPGSIAIIVAAAIAAYMAMNIGANDVTNNVGAAVGARAISLGGALLLAAFFEICGAVLGGSNVVQTIKADIVLPGIAPDDIVLIMISASLAAAVWINIATWTNAPVSTTHSIVGGIAGAGVAVVGAGAIHWKVMSGIAVSWLLSPILGALIAVAFLWFIKAQIIYKDDKIAAAIRWVPVLLAIMLGAFLSYLLIIAAPRVPDMGIASVLGIGAFAGIAGYVVFRDLIRRQAAELENRNQSLKVLFRMPLVFSAALLSFAHGANDVSNAIGPLAAIVEAAGGGTVTSALGAPFWIMAIGALGISTGLLLFGPRLIQVVGSQITRLNPFRAYCVAMAAAITVIIASTLGLPVSSTHVAVGAVFGVGLFREWYTAHSERRRLYIQAKADAVGGTVVPPPVEEPVSSDRGESESQRYRFLVRRSYLLSILAAWVITVPAAGLLAAIFATVLETVFS